MRKALAAAMLAGVPAVAVPAIAADPVELRFGFPAPAQSFVNTKGMTPWLEDVEKSADGALKIRLIAGPRLGDFRNIYDRTLDGVADISFGVFSPLAGQFRQNSVVGLPFECQNALEASLAQWRLYASGLTASEFDKVKVLALFTFPAAHVHTKTPLQPLTLKGLKFSVASKEEASLVGSLGGTPISQTPLDIYDSLQRGTTEAVVIAWTAVQTFKLFEVTKYHVETSLGMGGAFVFMNKTAYANLPAAAKAAIDKHSGEPFVRRLGGIVDEAAAGISKDVAAMPGQTVVPLPPDKAAEWRTLVKAIADNWVAETPNGAKVLAAFRQELQNIRQGR